MSTGSHDKLVCTLAEISDPGTHEFSIGEGEWPLRGFVVRQGEWLRAYVNRCPHAGHMLNLRPNRFFAPEENLLLCSSHGALFDSMTGECVAGPCAGKALQRLEIEVVDDSVWLIGSPDGG